MANITPIKAIYDGADVTALGEYTSTDTIAHSTLEDLVDGNILIGNSSDELVSSSLATEIENLGYGNKVFFQPGYPTFGTYSIGDLWWDTDDYVLRFAAPVGTTPVWFGV